MGKRLQEGFPSQWRPKSSQDSHPHGRLTWGQGVGGWKEGSTLQSPHP